MGTMNKRLLVAPFEKEGPLTLEEVRCPICWSVLIEPVTLPCKHSICLECFKKHIQEAALCCPCCRERISIWSRRAMKSNNLVNQPFWERLKKELPLFIQARLDGQDSQDVLNSLNFDCNDNGDCETANVESCKTYDGEISSTGEIRKEFESIHKQHLEDLENRRKREALASAEFIRKLQEEEQGIRLLASPQQSTSSSIIVGLEEKSASTSKSQVQPRQSRKLARNLLSEWSTDLSSVFEKCDPMTNETQSFDDESACEVPNQEEDSTKESTTTVKPTHSLNKFNTTRQVVEVTPFSTTQQASTSTKPKDSTSSFVLVQGPQVAVVPQLEKIAVGHEEGEEHRTVKFLLNQVKENFPKSSSTPDSINVELNSHFRPIRSAPKTPPKRLPDGSYLPEPRIVKSTPVRPRSISEEESPQPGLRIDRVEKLVRTADSEMSNGTVSGFVSSLPVIPADEESSESQCAHHEAETQKSDELDDAEGSQAQLQHVEEDSQEVSEHTGSDWPTASLPLNSSEENEEEEEEESVDKAEREYYLMQALQLEQFRLKKIQELEDRKYAELIHKTINKDVHPLVRSRESADRYSIRNWVSRDTQVETLHPVLSETHARRRKRTALALCTSVNDATSSASSNSPRRSSRISTAMKSTQNSAQSDRRKRGRPRKNL